jgi:hypothetical protein
MKHHFQQAQLINNKMLQVLGCCIRTKRYIKNLFQDEFEYSSGLEILGNKDALWITNVPKNSIFLEKITCRRVDERFYKYKVWYYDQLYMKPSMDLKKFLVNVKVESPWLWIGEGEIDMTNKLEEFILDGNVIRLELLNLKFPEIKNWSYLNSKTLELEVFPVEGIQIKHDSD